MRFRTLIENVSTFFKIIQAIEKLQKRCIIKFTPTNMYIICNNEANEGGIQVWSQIKIPSLFSNYRIESNASNEITISLSSEALLAALKSSSSSSSHPHSGSGPNNNNAGYEPDQIIMKLSKKSNQAYLSFTLSSISRRTGQPISVSHDVGIEVLGLKDVERLVEPMCPEPDLHILLPPLHKLRVVTDRLKPMSDVLALKANHNGSLHLSISTESVKVDTEWKNCVIPATTRPPDDDSNDDDEEQQQQPHEPPNPNHLFSVLVSIKSFSKFLNSHIVSTTTIACICQNHCMILYVYIGDVGDAGGVLTYYIPAIIGYDND